MGTIPHLGIVCAWEGRSATMPRHTFDFAARANLAKQIGQNGLAAMFTKAAQGEVMAGLGVDAAGIELTAFIGSIAGRFWAPAVASQSVDLPIRSVVGTFDPSGLVAAEPTENFSVAPVILSNGLIQIQPSKVVILLCYSREFLALRNAPQLLQHEVELAISRGLDKVFASRLSPGSAGGISATSSGNADWREMTSMLISRPGQNMLVAAAIDVCQRMAFLSPGGLEVFPLMPANGVGEVRGISVFPTDQLTAGTMLAVDSSGVSAQILAVEVESSPSAAVQLDTDPSMPAQLVSMFQTNSVALRVTCRFTCEPIRNEDVSVSVSDIGWTEA